MHIYRRFICAAMQRRMAQQQFMAQRQNGNAFMTGIFAI